jgi:CO/xanthine dehydrogenase FAD-binding subunit
MRAWLPDFTVHVARDVDDVLARLADGDWLPLAGGTDVMVVLAAGQLPAAKYVSIWGVPGLRGIDVRDDEVAIGALTTYTDVSEHSVLAREFPMLGVAARLSGAAAIQNRGTIGGNVANASPAADTPPALFAYGAEIELVGPGGRRRVPYADFHTGYKTTRRRPDELIASVLLPRPSSARRRVQVYRKVGTRKAQAIAKVGLAVAMELEGDVVVDCGVGLSSVAAVPLVGTRTAAALRGRTLADAIDDAVRALASEIHPIDDVRSTAEYRRRVAENLWRDVLEATLAGRAPIDAL